MKTFSREQTTLTLLFAFTLLVVSVVALNGGTRTAAAAPIPVHFILDRVVDGLATLEAEDGTTITVPSPQLPAGAKEGDVLTAHLTVDPHATARRRREVEALRNALPRGPSGDLTLPPSGGQR